MNKGLISSPKGGVITGRPKIHQEKIDIAIRMYQSSDYSVKEIIETNQLSLELFTKKSIEESFLE